MPDMSRPGAGPAAATRTTVREELLGALRSTSEHNRSDVVLPAAVLWTDRERRWETVVPSLREELPLLTFGPYEPEALTGPAIWLRCALAGTLPEVDLPEGTPVVYLPGVSRSDLRAVEDCPKHLQPLAELQYRGVIFSHPNGRDWTPAAFLGKRLGVEVAGSGAAQGALESLTAPAARARIAELEVQHGRRRGWVWAELGQSPLAEALAHLSALAKPHPARSAPAPRRRSPSGTVYSSTTGIIFSLLLSSVRCLVPGRGGRANREIAPVSNLAGLGSSRMASSTSAPSDAWPLRCSSHRIGFSSGGT